MRIRNLLEDKNITELATVRPECTLVETAMLLSDKKIGALPVIDSSDNMVGIISERDVVRSLARFHGEVTTKTVSDVMITSVITCSCNDGVESVYNMMDEKRIRHVPVMSEGALVGILSLRDFQKNFQFLHENAVTDDLTGMINARAFAEHLEVEFNRYRRFQFPLSVIVMQVGGYAEATSNHGHAEGERLLKGLADALKEQIRQFDIVGHVTEDIFGVILPNTDSKAAHRACARLLRGAKEFIAQDPQASDLKMGIGLAMADVDTREHMAILESAEALAAKALGEGGHAFEVSHPAQPGLQAAE